MIRLKLLLAGARVLASLLKYAAATHEGRIALRTARIERLLREMQKHHEEIKRLRGEGEAALTLAKTLAAMFSPQGEGAPPPQV